MTVSGDVGLVPQNRSRSFSFTLLHVVDNHSDIPSHTRALDKDSVNNLRVED